MGHPDESIPASRLADVLREDPGLILSNIFRRLDLPALVKRVHDLDIVDLGCGSYERSDQGTVYPPVLCETLHTLGANVTGVDRPYVEQKHPGEWHFVPLDLRDPDVLRLFPSNSTDLVNMHSLIGHSNPCLTSPALGFWDLDNPIYKALEEKLFTQVLRMLRPGGLMLVNDEHLYQKHGDSFPFEFLDLISN